MEWEQTYSSKSSNGQAGLRRRNIAQIPPSYSNTPYDDYPRHSGNESKSFKKKLKKLDMFPKVEQDLTVHAESSSFMNILANILILIIVLAEIYNYYSINSAMVQHMKVDKSIGTKMKVDLNITFPALHCNDLHIDIMDVAGDAHNDVHDTIQKTRLHLDGTKLSDEEIRVSVNKAHKKEKDILDAIDKTLAADYCGPCFGADETEGQCCNHCQDVIDAYKKKHWDYSSVKELAEQCVREGKTKPKKLETEEEGCRIAGYMEFGRVNGNFHIAMGEGVERKGQHIHTFLPEDTSRFNVSHVIHELRFGPVYGDNVTSQKSRNSMEKTSLNGVSKIVTQDNGVSGMFQYFIKIVPTSYKGRKIVKEIDPSFDKKKEPLLETNRYFVTERFTPLMEVDEEHWELGQLVDADDDKVEYAGAKVGGKTGLGHDKHEQHLKQKAILPGVFFIYQVYPFAVEISKQEIPLTHLLIRILATIGGVFTIVGWLDAVVCSRNKRNRGLSK